MNLVLIPVLIDRMGLKLADLCPATGRKGHKKTSELIESLRFDLICLTWV